MKRRNGILLLFLLALSLGVRAQGYMATKTELDSLKVGKFHGNASLGGKVEQADAFKFELDASLECMVPFQRHKLRLAGNISFNMINMLDNGNKGFAYIAGDFYQFNIKEDHRYKNPIFFSAIGGAQYDFCRNLDARLFIGFMATFQPLRNHPHLCLEPAVGILADFMYWNILGSKEQVPMLDYYNWYCTEHPWVKDYLGINEKGYRWQTDPSIAVSVNFMGAWDKISFNLFAFLAQPVTPAFKIGESEKFLPGVLQGMYNNNYLPMVTVDASLKIKLTTRFALVLKGEFLWDGGQLPAKRYVIDFGEDEIHMGARCMRYSSTLGFAVNW